MEDPGNAHLAYVDMVETYVQQAKESIAILNVMGTGSVARIMTIEFSEDFIEARHKHAAVESAINALENHGLDRCLDFGLDGFKRYVALAVLARNIQILGAKLRHRSLKRQRRLERLAA